MNLYDRVFFKPLPLTDVRNSIDPYTPEEREMILEGFRTKRPHYFTFVYFQFWTGARVSETTALRYGEIDLRYATARIQRSRVQGHEAGTKTQRSNREIHLHETLVEVLKAHMPLHIEPDDYVFTTTERGTNQRRQLLPSGMAADAPQTQHSATTLLQHPPLVREFSALHRSKICLRLKLRREIASGRLKLTTRGISQEPIQVGRL